MKTWENAEVVSLELEKTAFGPTNPDKVDETKYAVTDEKGNVLGWEQLYGDPKASNNN